MSKQSSITGPHAPSWPSKANRTDPQNDDESVCTGEIEDEASETYRDIAMEFVKDAEGDLAGRIFRAISVSSDTKLRREAVRERRGEPGSFRSKSLAGVMQEFLTWYQRQDDLVLEFPDFQMDAGSSYDEDAARERYGRLRDLERGALEACRQSSDDLYTALIGITASHKNANNQYRCPADHWREMRDSWSDHVRQEQQRVFDQLGANRYDPDDPPERWWEYVRIVEPHKSGYGHHHIAVVTNFEISVEDFEPVITKHVEETPSANWSAHQIHADHPEDRCVSVNRVQPESDGDGVGNLASYLSGYLSEFTDDDEDDDEYLDLLDRAAHEVMFSAVQWATASRKIDFSNGAHALRRIGNDLRPEEYQTPEPEGDVPAPTSVVNQVTGDSHLILEPGGVEMVPVQDRPEYDPEKVFPGGALEATR
ncbi:hypothetical protein [Halorhabdus sp. CUG00001]|uniref:hypothetical protein n=1 Tax=Halorhabdus sp. CUG00001 TaxID=2600297 RepID=UPI00131AE1F5|nr:hypothetical protein [Halorhabdus sp. CUG00001]